MKFMKRRNLGLFAVAALLPLMAANVPAQFGKQPAGVTETAATQQFERIVRNFLAAVPKGDRQTFEKFFANDVIYTRSAGVTVDKAEVLRNIGVRAVNEPKATYDADDFTVHAYGEMAIVNFRLLQQNERDGKPETNYFRNTGTFLKRQGKWQVVAWQSTRVPAETGSTR